MLLVASKNESVESGKVMLLKENSGNQILKDFQVTYLHSKIVYRKKSFKIWQSRGTCKLLG